MIPTEVTQFENLLNNTTTLDYFMFDNNEVVSITWGDNIQISENHAKYQFTATYPNLDLLVGYTFYTPVMDPQEYSLLHGHLVFTRLLVILITWWTV